MLEDLLEQKKREQLDISSPRRAKLQTPCIMKPKPLQDDEVIDEQQDFSPLLNKDK